MVTMKVFVDGEGFCFIKNALINSIEFEFSQRHLASLKKTRKYKYEVNVPLQTVGQFVKNNLAFLDIYEIQRLNNEKE
ncbi:hypothetical protein SRABI82_04728 [Priestia megaterium]|nr:hypothetical protein SRABI82_04728 [Priestia megaterium]